MEKNNNVYYMAAGIEIRDLPETREPWRKLKNYVLSDFNITKTLGSGTFGETHLGTFIGTTNEVVIKFYPKYTGYLKQDMAKELLFLNYLNQFPETKTVRLYGYIFEPGTPPRFGLVLEKLEKTLTNFTINIRSSTAPEKFRGRLRPKEYKLLFYKMLKGLANIHGLGIVHNDIKLDNIMISRTDIRYIDFGLADYLGVIPFSPNVSNYITTEIFKAPDIGDTRSEKYIDGNRKSYGSDVYSLGVTFLNMIYKFYYIFRWTPDDIEALHFSDQRSEGFTKDFVVARLRYDPKDTDDLSLEDAENGFDLIHKMLNPNAKLRISAKDALNHPYFTDIVAVETSENLDRVLSLGGGPDIFAKIPFRMVSTETFEARGYEIKYVDDIFMNTKDDKIPFPVKYSRTLLPFINYILYINKTKIFDVDNGVISYTGLLSMVSFCRNLPRFRPTIMMDLANIYSFFNSVFNYKSAISSDRLKKFNGEEDLNFEDTTLFILEQMTKVSFITIANQIDFVKLQLIFEYPDDKLEPFVDKIISEIMVYVFLLCISPMDLNMTNWEIVSVLTTYLVNKIAGIPTEELLERPIISDLDLTDYDRKITKILDQIEFLTREIGRIEDSHKTELRQFIPEK